MSDPSLFHSLGDNCEFGFLQRNKKCESPDLLRWAVSPPEVLIRNIENDFQQIYEFNNLFPVTDNMVVDNGTGLKFHTRMTSKNRVFVLGDSERREVYADEYKRVALKRRAFLEEMSTPVRHFVYKHNRGVTDDQCHRLARAIASKGRGALLVVHAGVQGKSPGDVEYVSDNLYFGYLREFAKYERADKFDLDCWMRVLEKALTLMPPLPAHAT